MATLELIVTGILFVLSSGILFNKRFRRSAFLVSVTGIVAMVSTISLVGTLRPKRHNAAHLVRSGEATQVEYMPGDSGAQRQFSRDSAARIAVVKREAHQRTLEQIASEEEAARTRRLVESEHALAHSQDSIVRVGAFRHRLLGSWKVVWRNSNEEYREGAVIVFHSNGRVDYKQIFLGGGGFPGSSVAIGDLLNQRYEVLDNQRVRFFAGHTWLLGDVWSPPQKIEFDNQGRIVWTTQLKLPTRVDSLVLALM